LAVHSPKNPGLESTNKSLEISNRQEYGMKTFLIDDTGLELSEYAVAAALVAIAVVAAFTALGNAIGVRLNELVNRVAGT
jgi:pilus assembly protein Flp/PilA